MTGGIPRRQARELAFQFLYGCLGPDRPASGAEHFAHGDFVSFCANFGQKPDDFAWELAQGTGKNLPRIDESIGKISAHWRIERMPRVDLTILRMACHEILDRADIPKTVSINEAIELAKRFGAEDTPAFVNGILDKLEKGPVK